ncbi:MAG: hypothetical protein AAF367_19440 [Pseudomonadota bacterium]
MSCSSFPNLRESQVVADTSVLINLDASGYAGEIVQAACGVLCTTENAFDELLEGERLGYSTASDLRELKDLGLLKVLSLDEREEPIYRSLIEGSAAQTLGDGEAATISYATNNDAAALIDEKKAKRICGERFNDLQVATTTDVMLHPNVAKALGGDHEEAVFMALTKARMHVPRHHIQLVVNLLGEERLDGCSSLPKHVLRSA